MADFSGGLFGSSNLATAPGGAGYIDTMSSTDSGFTMDPSFYGGDDSGSGTAGPGPGGGGINPTEIGGALGGGVGALAGDIFGPLGAIAGGVGGTALGQYLGSYFTPGGGGSGGRRKGTHLNRSTYVTQGKRDGGGMRVVQKGSKQVTNRRRNAGNARAVRRALGRLAMFDNLARKVEGEMARVARRHHRAAPRPVARHRGHRPGCRCFACRR